jgi:hypothetical protein
VLDSLDQQATVAINPTRILPLGKPLAAAAVGVTPPGRVCATLVCSVLHPNSQQPPLCSMTAAPSSCTHASLAQGGSTAVAAAAAVVEQQQQAQQRRPTCAGCGRPLRVCYCAALPAQPLQLHGRVVILQHPHELK